MVLTRRSAASGDENDQFDREARAVMHGLGVNFLGIVHTLICSKRVLSRLFLPSENALFLLLCGRLKEYANAMMLTVLLTQILFACLL